MVQAALSCLNQISSYLKVQQGKININGDSIITRTKDKNVQSGFVNIIMDLVNESKIKNNITTQIEKVQLWQWLEYCISYAVHLNSHQNNQHILNELNGVLKFKTYLIAHKLTIADVALYYILYNVMLNLTPVEKETYLNVSRWFDNLQQNSAIRQSNKLLNFTSNYVIHRAPSRHL
ncbi:eukaryotic translation elongation factor 1 epsilon-1 [Coccinella septempunctata]|uniref:eukaryotic translation elongation factor 1 epsilon-1 n=1 Tax=Coccinella septempunctata TaxID=41139 RepID=UPI001D075527|nr:eukaryotic translation elongation factor 1 epsilon-1 [Coccinella septempunctata]